MSVSVCVCLKGNENIENQGRKGCDKNSYVAGKNNAFEKNARKEK